MNIGALNPAGVRALARFAIATQVVFVAAWLIAGELQGGYSHVEQYVSELGSGTADNPWLVNGAIVLLGSSFAALALGLRAALPKGRRSAIVVGLFGLCATLYVVSGLFASECQVRSSRRASGDSTTARCRRRHMCTSTRVSRSRRRCC